MKGTSVDIKNMWIKQLLSDKFWDFATAFRCENFSGPSRTGPGTQGPHWWKPAKVDEVLGPTAFFWKPALLLTQINLFWFQAVYNLAYMVEYNYSLNGIQWNNVDKNDFLQGNLTFAASLYQK